MTVSSVHWLLQLYVLLIKFIVLAWLLHTIRINIQRFFSGTNLTDFVEGFVHAKKVVQLDTKQEAIYEFDIFSYIHFNVTLILQVYLMIIDLIPEILMIIDPVSEILMSWCQIRFIRTFDRNFAYHDIWWRNNETTIPRWWKFESTMVKIRTYIEFSLLSFSVFDFSLITMVLSTFHHRTFVFSPSWFRYFDFSPSYFRILVLSTCMSVATYGPNGTPSLNFAS